MNTELLKLSTQLPQANINPLKFLNFPHVTFVLLEKKETLKGESSVKEGLSPLASWPAAVLLSAPSI